MHPAMSNNKTTQLLLLTPAVYELLLDGTWLPWHEGVRVGAGREPVAAPRLEAARGGDVPDY